MINAVDDQGQQSRVERLFYLNNTLGYLRVRPTRVVVRRRGGSLRVGFRLAHSARVTLTIETASGARVRTITRRLGRGQKRFAGTAATATASALSRGRTSRACSTSNSFGPSELERRFIVRRARR